MVGKKSGRALLKEEGLQRTDNNMQLTSFPTITPINQKNYYTDFLKTDDQVLAFRLQQEENRNRMAKAARDKDRALAQTAQNETTPADGDFDMKDAESETEAEPIVYGSRTIIIHPGSQNLRIGLATDALPKTIPMVIARKSALSENEENDGEPRPKRIKLDDGQFGDESTWFGPEFADEYNSQAADFKTFRRANRRRVLPNSRELVWNWNSRNPPDNISRHHDNVEYDWTDVSAGPEYITGSAALRIPEDSKPRYRLYRPWRHGMLNEREYKSKVMLFTDLFLIIRQAIQNETSIGQRRDFSQYSCVFIIPDLYDRSVVTQALHEFLVEFGFQRVCFLQESVAATFGAGYSISCIVDVGAEKTSICCVDEGMCIENSRINLKYGGEDVTETFIKMMLFDKFNYNQMNLNRRSDHILAEELKQKYCTLSDEQITVRGFDFFVRTFEKDTKKYTFKAYDELMLAPLGMFRPAIYDHSQKLKGRWSLVPRSTDIYDHLNNDPTSTAQTCALVYANENIPSAILHPPPLPTNIQSKGQEETSQKLALGNKMLTLNESSEHSPNVTPAPNGNIVPKRVENEDNMDETINAAGENGDEEDKDKPEEIVEEEPVDDLATRIVPVMPLDQAIITSITEGAKDDEKKFRDFIGGIMVIGGASKLPNFSPFLEYRLRGLKPNLAKDILVGGPPRELDPQVLVWKGASVFGKLQATNDCWIGKLEYDRLGARILNYKCMWVW